MTMRSDYYEPETAKIDVRQSTRQRDSAELAQIAVKDKAVKKIAIISFTSETARKIAKLLTEMAGKAAARQKIKAAGDDRIKA